MTSTTGTDEHPEVAEISALAEGVLSPSRTADVREHLADCELCDDVRNSLDEIRGLLGTLPGPLRMPTDVAGRIDAALAAEALLSATAPATTSTAQGTADAENTENSADLVSRETVLSAPVSAGPVSAGPVSVGPVSVSRETGDRPPARPRATTGPGRQTPASSGPRGRRVRRWPKVLLGSACAAAVLGAGSFFLLNSGSDDQTDTPQAAPSSTAIVLGSGELKTRVHELLEKQQGVENAETRGMSAPNSPNTTLFGTGTTAPACIQQGTKRSDAILAAHPERYNGEEAYLVVLPHPGNEALVDAYVVSATCVTASPSSPGKVLADRTVPRG
ncbi:zf-HC2 domain-containing protein [Streptomyces syringium]|uniref:zf-HC2 domain-containing protein n=1 Tax=Streptomyces syringium TaxID=76729 RepID=UPI003456AD16